jgi:tetratricopeptide (TPR) repeat protein
MSRAAVALACIALAACAPMPPAPEPAAPAVRAPQIVEPAAPTSRSGAVVRHLRLAQAARDAGDLASAADHLEVVVLLSPKDPAHRKALDATRDAIRRGVREHTQTGINARRSGDLGAARDAYLHVLALDPDNADAVKAMRDIEHQIMARTQGDRAARARPSDAAPAIAKARVNDALDLDQPLELVRAGDLVAGLREAKAWVDAHPSDRAGRGRLGAAVAEKAREAEGKGQRETALSLYEQAVSLAGAGTSEWTLRMQALRKALGEKYYNDGMKVFRSDLDNAIRLWETGARYDPSNLNLQMRLREAKLAQQKLRTIRQ